MQNSKEAGLPGTTRRWQRGSTAGKRACTLAPSSMRAVPADEGGRSLAQYQPRATWGGNGRAWGPGMGPSFATGALGMCTGVVGQAQVGSVPNRASWQARKRPVGALLYSCAGSGRAPQQVHHVHAHSLASRQAVHGGGMRWRVGREARWDVHPSRRWGHAGFLAVILTSAHLMCGAGVRVSRAAGYVQGLRLQSSSTSHGGRAGRTKPVRMRLGLTNKASVYTAANGHC